MSSIAINKKLLDNHFRFLKNLDNASKKILISKLTKSIAKSKNKNNLDRLFGAWKDVRSADEIIEDIRNSRVNSKDIEDL